MAYDIWASCCSLFVERRHTRDVLSWRKRSLCVLYWRERSLCMMNHALGLLSHAFQSIEWIREGYVCVFMKVGKGKRIMRSNRRETWGSLNLPPWLSTSYIVSIYCFSLCRLQIVFIYYGKNWEISLYVGRLCPIFSKNMQKISAPWWL